MSQSFDDATRGTDGMFIACLLPRYHGTDDTPATQMDDARLAQDRASDCWRLVGDHTGRSTGGYTNVVNCSGSSSINPPEPMAIKNEINAVSDAEKHIHPGA